MPIIGFGFFKSKWSIDRELTNKQLADFLHILNDVIHDPKYNKANFTKTIKLNLSFLGSYVATYDIAKSGLIFASYKELLEDVVFQCNERLINVNKYKAKYKNYKFDIEGNWEEGQIIIMKSEK